MILFRYLFREVFISMTAVTAILLVVVMSSRFIRYLADAAVGDIATEILFQVMLFRFPSFLEMILPLGLFLGIMLSYGRLYMDNEMTVMFSCGISRKQLTLWTIIFALLVSGMVGFLSLYLTPFGTYQEQKLLDRADNSWQLSTLIPGRFQMSDGGKKVSYAQEMNSERTRMNNIFISSYQRKPSGAMNASVTIAEAAKVATDPVTGKKYLELINGYIYEGQPGQRKYSVTQFERYGQLLKDEESDKDALILLSGSKTTKQLWQSHSLIDQAALQWRLSLPVLPLVIALLAMVLSETTPRQGRYFKMFPAIFLYLLYLGVLIALRGQIEKGNLSPAVGAWPLHGFMLGLVVFISYWPALQSRLHPIFSPVYKTIVKVKGS